MIIKRSQKDLRFNFSGIPVNRDERYDDGEDKMCHQLFSTVHIILANKNIKPQYKSKVPNSSPNSKVLSPEESGTGADTMILQAS